MLYIIGNKKNYLEDKLFKSPGGYAFETIEEARRRIIEEKIEGTWGIFVMETTLENMLLSPNDWWRFINENAPSAMIED